MLNGNWALSAMEFSFDHVLIDKRKKKNANERKFASLFSLFLQLFSEDTNFIVENSRCVLHITKSLIFVWHMTVSNNFTPVFKRQISYYDRVC